MMEPLDFMDPEPPIDVQMMYAGLCPRTENEEIREEIVGAMFFLFAGLVMGVALGMLIAKVVFA